MKIFKVKCMVLSFLLATMVSCSKDETIKEADNVATASSKSFEFRQDINNYLVDGQITYDRQLISKAAETAWNIHYDFPHNRVSISTTASAFNKYKNTAEAFKNNTETPEDDMEIAEKVFGTCDEYGAINGNNKLEESYAKAGEYQGVSNLLDILNNSTYTNFSIGLYFFIGNSDSSKFFTQFTNNTDCNVYPQNTVKVNTAGTSVSTQLVNMSVVTKNLYSGTSSIRLRNDALVAKNVTFYSGTKYTGSSVVVSLKANKYVKFSTNLFSSFTDQTVKSYKSANQ
jgi:hypothetical protein